MFDDYLLVPTAQNIDEPLYRGLKQVYRVERYLNLIVQTIMFVSMFGLATLVATEVAFRYWLKLPVLGVMEAAPLLASWAYFVGMVCATRNRDHISGGISGLVFKSRSSKLLVRLLVAVICLTVLAVIGYYSLEIAWAAAVSNRVTPYLHWPRILWNASLVTGILLMIPYYILDLFLAIRALGMKDPSARN